MFMLEYRQVCLGWHSVRLGWQSIHTLVVYIWSAAASVALRLGVE